MEFIPTYLYIKQHSITGKLYFGKTQRDVLDYIGSGTHWKRHVNKHGYEHVITLWYELFNNKEELISFATSFSKEMDIVESKQWANIIEENGMDGNPKGIQISQEQRLKSRLAHLGKMHTPESKQKMSMAAKTRPKRKYLEVTRIKQQDVMRNKEPIKCPHCNKEGHPSIMKRHHFSNCKLNIYTSKV